MKANERKEGEEKKERGKKGEGAEAPLPNRSLVRVFYSKQFFPFVPRGYHCFNKNIC